MAEIDDEIRRLAADMQETMYDADGIGLAAPQVGVPIRLFVYDVRERGISPGVLVNPEIVEEKGAVKEEEGCLSIPGLSETVERSESIVARGLDLDGEPVEIRAEGILSRCIQAREGPPGRDPLPRSRESAQAQDPAREVAETGAGLKRPAGGHEDSVLGHAGVRAPLAGGDAGAGHEIAGVVTNPDRPAGRGRGSRPWAATAGESGEGVGAGGRRAVLQPVRPGEEDFLAAARRLGPDISVVAAYGRLLPRAALDLPPLGSLNVHASLLPELRGAAPINWAIIRGHRESGISIQRMVVELDAGPVLGQTRIPISATMTAGALYEEAAEAGGARLVAVLDDLASGRAVETPQDDARATWAPKLDREAARIDWSRPAAEVANRLRGCDPWPAAWTSLAAPAGLAGTRVQCFEPRVGDCRRGRRRRGKRPLGSRAGQRGRGRPRAATARRDGVGRDRHRRREARRPAAA